VAVQVGKNFYGDKAHSKVETQDTLDGKKGQLCRGRYRSYQLNHSMFGHAALPHDPRKAMQSAKGNENFNVRIKARVGGIIEI
jgi:hypothetical protein